ncbi:diguanylate cyclase domain-containing protein [Pseudomonas sp. 5Ae-yellow]|uniref:sensor domain-containing protein n=1 Tax=Pseudomonas sp. 5Ae-yellow TaxID=2759848 RepID=UPI0015F3906F|nr:diguanylate cyclase [Pseudomonas sp. 5Ae-yellow]MBA6418395.1 diguanylate cyclase [Pseudomonas sp. 5Ae-yellow]|tara:strand:+ start:532 stop:1839 length:1308 start_codon:yes stop_codon:yes gene_type:complete
MNSKIPMPPAPHLVDMLLDAVCMVDEHGTFVYISAACERIFGYTQDELIGRHILGLLHPDDIDATLLAAQRVRNGELIPHFENRYLRKDGSVVHIMWSSRWSEEDQLRIAVARDITERKQYEVMQSAVYAISEAANNAEDLNTLCSHVHQIVDRLLPVSIFSLALHDPGSGEIHFRYHGSDSNLTPTELASRTIADGKQQLFTAGDETDTTEANWLGVPLLARETAFGALVLHRQAGGATFSEEDRALLQYVSTQIATAVQRVQMQSRLQFLSHHDQLTGLPNRALLNDRLVMARSRAEREGSGIALLFLDLDRFKEINDSMGHAIGDLLLQEVASRLRSVVRAADTVARMGGDEFVLLLESITLEEDACQVAEKVCNKLNAVYHLDGHEVQCGTSIGIAVNLTPAEGSEHLLKRADQAMYRAKQQGGNRYALAE